MTFRRLLSVFLVVVAWTAALELCLHMADLKIEGSFFIPDDVRRFRLRPDASAWHTTEGETLVAINSRGFRDRERTPGTHRGIFRIAVLGDSAVAGFEVTQKETFTEVAEVALARLIHTGKVEVLNFGTPNYNLAQQYLTLRDEVFAYEPDMVVEAVSLTNAILNSTRETCVNDSPYPYFLEKDGRLELYDPPQPKGLNIPVESALLDAENRIDLALLFLKAQRNFLELAGNLEQRAHFKPGLPEHFYERSLFPPRDEGVARAWRISEQTLKLMRNLCASRHVPFWIATMDVAGQVDPDLRMREHYRERLGTQSIYYADSRLIDFAGSENIPCTQMALALGDFALRTGECVHGFFNTPRNYGHLNVVGHRVVGETLANSIATSRTLTRH
jgi:hypothetical protein